MPKTFEKLLVPKCTTVLDKVISDNQHGFRHSRSTTTNLLTYYTDLISYISKGIQVDAVYTNIRKAFDSVDSSILVKKLEIVGIVGPMHAWLESYLNGRTQQVKLGDSVLLSINVTSGVSLGGHLSPILFTLFINDVKDILKSSNFLMFADDLKLYMPIYSHEDCLNLQADLDDFCLWCSLNGLNVNAEKCSQISFSRRKKILTFNMK